MVTTPDGARPPTAAGGAAAGGGGRRRRDGRRCARAAAPTARSRCPATRTRRRASLRRLATAAAPPRVSPTRTIKVAFRVLNEKGFQQTLAELAGAACPTRPTPSRARSSALAEYFNQRFQFYGRKIEIVFYDGKGSNTNELLGKGREQAVADAIKVAEEIGAFADLSATSEPYAGALADREGDRLRHALPVPQVARGPARPYAWSIATDGIDRRPSSPPSSP